MEDGKTNKAFRLLIMHERLSRGETIIKETMLSEFGMPTKTFQRDINSLRLYYSEHSGEDLVFDRRRKCYRLRSRSDKLTKQEVFAVCKVLIESRAFNSDEFNNIITKILKQCDAAEAKTVKSLIANEQVNYIPLQHEKPLVDTLWELASNIAEQSLVEILYRRLDGKERRHEVKPVGIMFSEFYFYLIAFLADDSKKFPTVFRVDRISGIERQAEKFSIPYSDRFSEAEFRKRVQFMYGGELRTVRFSYKGGLEAVLDRLPTARIESESEDGVVIRAEAFGNGIDMWLNSQGDKVKLLK